MQSRPDRLDVYYGSDLVGAVNDSAPLAFEYASTWLDGGQRMSLAAIPLRAGRQATPEVQAFFENLLPEGELRDYLAAQRKASTLFSLLLEVAGDTAGAFVLVAPGQTPDPPRYEATTWEAIAAILAKRSASAIDIHEQGARISLAGAQDKTVRPAGSDSSQQASSKPGAVHFEVPPMRAQVDEYRLYSGRCAGCGKLHSGVLSAGVPKGSWGHARCPWSACWARATTSRSARSAACSIN